MKNKELIIVNNFFSTLRTSLGWLQFGSQAGIALREFEPLIQHLHRVFQTRGRVGGLLYIKAVRGAVMNFLSGNPERFQGVKYAHDGLPLCLGPLLKYYRRECPPREILQFTNTVLFSTRALKTKADPNFDTITAPSKRGTSYDRIHRLAEDFWIALGYRHQGIIPRALRFRRFHLSTKAGPQGHALGSWFRDLLSLPKQLRESIVTIGGVKIKEFLEAALENQSILERFINFIGTKANRYPGEIRRLVVFPDKEGKTRIIAILDYFSQTVLKGLHSYIFKALRKIPQDMTFNQGAFQDRIKGWQVFYSVDLSAATDRFPISLESQVLRAHLPAPYVWAWEHIMVGYPFRIEDKYVKDGLTHLSYAVGNPMGAYSSWASFALAHHYIFYFISRELRREFSTLPYVLLGDDVLIGDEDVAELYLKIIQDLGIDVSKAKTHISKDICEFAKRWIYKGQEISPFPISALRGSGKRYYLLVALLKDLEKKGWSWIKGIDQMVVKHLQMFKPNVAKRSFAKTLGDKAFVTEQILEIIWGAPPAVHMLNVARRLGIRLSTIQQTDALCLDIVRNVLMYLFSSGNPAASPRRRDKGNNLGLLAENWVMYLTGLLEEFPQAMTLLENPQLHAYGNIEATYLSLRKIVTDRQKPDALHIDWPLTLRSVTIPMDDGIFIDKMEETYAMGAARMSKLFVAGLRDIASSPATIRCMDYSSFLYWDSEVAKSLRNLKRPKPRIDQSMHDAIIASALEHKAKGNCWACEVPLVDGKCPHGHKQ